MIITPENLFSFFMYKFPEWITIRNSEKLLLCHYLPSFQPFIPTHFPSHPGHLTSKCVSPCTNHITTHPFSIHTLTLSQYQFSFKFLENYWFKKFSIIPFSIHILFHSQISPALKLFPYQQCPVVLSFFWDLALVYLLIDGYNGHDYGIDALGLVSECEAPMQFGWQSTCFCQA